MAVPEPCVLYPVSFAAPVPVLRVVTGGVERDASLTGIIVGALRGWFVAEDDLIAELLDALNGLAGGVTWTADLSDDNVLTLTSSGTAELLWSHVSTTLDPTVFGWTAVDVGPGTSFVAPNQTRGIWIPGTPTDARGFLEDTLAEPQTAAVITRTLDGAVRGYDLSPEPDVRTVSWYRIDVSRVLASHAVAGQPFCTFTEAWTTGGLAAGEIFRLYDDRTDRLTFAEYQVTKTSKPWRLEEMNGVRRYEIGPLELVEAV